MKQMSTTAMREANGGKDRRKKYICPFCGEVYHFGFFSAFVNMFAYPAHLKTCPCRKRA
ncbi:MAG: hypothetical protein II931_00605 [Clostridia bacterium]|nr:hypothetical protein [Clostridia bacterium]